MIGAAKKSGIHFDRIEDWPRVQTLAALALLYRAYEVSMSTTGEPLPQLRFEMIEAARILRLSRATLYQRIKAGEIQAQKDGRRRYITATELQRYVTSKI